ncbi:hypothetical protein MSG28_006049 [Choristoneura fumiferana]|uniref:Uncharacterized protein n=1 Tax=Choristoneura fumiferana TaxID=7141 RepID=A0ACC0JDE7_CHOFU|nr:hypothetical protein MSG28_006049 [Choristoneura fumiferana]
MDDALMNHYEKQLYTVFKTFDVDNEEALDRAAVLQLCDALQLEARGAALVDSLFERRADRVTFATFRNGLLGVLGAAPAAEPAPAPPPAPPPAPHSDDDSSGREVAPKFVVGAKKYGRRSRPARGGEEPGAPRAASASRLDADADAARRPRMRYKRSASAMEPRAGDARLDHERRIDCAQAVELCRDLRMDGIDPRLVERIFEAEPSEETTVGEFFERLNVALTSIATGGDAEPASAPALAALPAGEQDDAEDALPGEAVAEAWERAGVRRPRRLLAELGFTAAAVRALDLERALDDELRALGSPPPAPSDDRPPLQLAALALARLRLARARARAAAAAAERDKLRADLAEANRRAQLLAQDVDDNHARLEEERQAALRQLEARHAEAARAAAEERAAERERAAASRAALEAEAARRGEAEARLREELAALAERADGAERRAAANEERAEAAERERAQAEAEARAAAARTEDAEDRERATADALGGRLRALQEDNARLRDRADELAAALEARAPPAPPPAPGPADTSWRDETEAELDADALSLDRIDECDSAPASMERRAGSGPGCARADAAAQTEPAAPAAEPSPAPDALLEDLRQKHEAEKAELIDSIASLERGLEALRLEGERCEEYWAAKLREERAAAADDAAAADARLADLLRRVADYERAFRPQLPALHETSLEPQYHQLLQWHMIRKPEFEEFKAEAARELAATREAAAARAAEAERELAAARAAAARPPGCSCHQKPRRAASDGEPPAAHAGRRRRRPEWPTERLGRRGGRGGRGGRAARRCVVVMRVWCDRQGQLCACGGGWGARGAWGAWGRGRAAGAAEAAALRSRAAHAERAAARLLARLQAADALVADLYRENCQLQHHARAPRLL